jgi:RNA recognition motif-containing protein
VKIADGSAAPVGNDSEEKTNIVFVGQLSWNVDNDWLGTEFAEYGEVVSARVQMDRNTGKSRGFGFVEFSSSDAVDAAVAASEQKVIDGRAVRIDKSGARQPNPEKRAKAFGDAPSEPSLVLFVGNVSFNTSEDNLWEVFAEYGEVKSVRLPTDRESGRPKGFGYVEFTDMEGAKKAFEGAQGKDVDGRNLRLDYSQPRTEGGGGGGRGRGRGGGDSGWGGRGGDRGGRVSFLPTTQ